MVLNSSITTAAGGGSAGDGGTPLNALVILPAGLALDASGNPYVTDTDARVRSVINGVINTVAGDGIDAYSGPGFGDGGSATSVSLNDPEGAALDASGNLYIADSGNCSVREVSAGVITTLAGGHGCGYNGDNITATSAMLNEPTGVAVDSTGNVYIADNYNHRVRKISGGTITTIAGTGSPGFSGDGVATLVELNNPRYVALDSSGNLYISDFTNNRVRRLSNGMLTTVAGNGAAGYSGEGIATAVALNSPSGIAIDGAGNLFIAEWGGQRIREVTGGMTSTIAGTGTPGFSGDGGPATSAQIDIPQQLALDTSGNVFFSDSDNNRVRVIHSGKCAFGVGPPGYQPGAVSSYLPLSYSFSATGGIGSFNVIPPSAGQVGCGWTANTNATWIAINNGSSGTDAGIVSYQIQINTSNTARTGAITIAGVTFTITQAGIPASCQYSVVPAANSDFTTPNSNTLLFGASGGPAMLTITAGAGCPWGGVSSVPSWLTIDGSSTGAGNGQLSFTVSANGTGAVLNGAISIAGQVFLITETSGSGSLTCGAIRAAIPETRPQGQAELMGDIVFVCNGTAPAGGITADVQLVFPNVTITSRLLSSSSNLSEALLFVNEPATPVLNTNTFSGAVISANTVLFPNIPLASTAGPISNLIIRTANLRFNAAALATNNNSVVTITANAYLYSAGTPISLGAASLTTAVVGPGLTSQVGSAAAGPDTSTQVTIPLTYTEGFANAFRLHAHLDPTPVNDASPVGPKLRERVYRQRHT